MVAGVGVTGIMTDYFDPLEAAKKRQVPKSLGVSYFPGVNVRNNDLTAGSIYKPGSMDEIMGDVPPTPTPTPTPSPRLIIPAFPRPVPRYAPIPIEELVKRYAY